MQCAPEIFQSLIAELLERGEVSTFRVHGTSMYPTIRDGEVIAVARVEASNLRTGDIIAFSRGANLCVHRIARIEHDAQGRVLRLLSTGDGLWVPDGFCSVDDVLGVVIEVRTSHGSWRPNTRLRRAQGRLRSFLTLHPRVRAPLSAVKEGLRRVMMSLAGPRGPVQHGGVES